MELKGTLDIKNALIKALHSHRKNNFKDAKIIYQEILKKNLNILKQFFI